MIFRADSSLTFACEPYRIIWSTRGWELWRWAQQEQRCLGRELTMGEALQMAERDEKREPA